MRFSIKVGTACHRTIRRKLLRLRCYAGCSCHYTSDWLQHLHAGHFDALAESSFCTWCTTQGHWRQFSAHLHSGPPDNCCKGGEVTCRRVVLVVGFQQPLASCAWWLGGWYWLLDNAWSSTYCSCLTTGTVCVAGSHSCISKAATLSMWQGADESCLRMQI